MSKTVIEIPIDLSGCSKWFSELDWKTIVDLDKLEGECDSCKFYDSCVLAHNKDSKICLYK